MHRKLASTICSVVLLLISLAPAMLTSAAGINLIANPSVETASGSLPVSWKQGKWGTNTTTFSYQTTGHTGTRSLAINMSKYTSGDAKWYFTDVTVKPNTQYTYSEFYKSSVATEIDIQYTSTTGALSYAYLAAPAVSASSWATSTSNFTTPANVKTLTIFHAINKVGTLQTDDFSLAETAAVTPTPPTVAFTAPAANATVSGTQTINANATDTLGMAGVQFKVDSTLIGVEDTAAPYSVSLDTTTIANGSHILSAIARNTSNLTTTVTETVNVQNVVTTPPAVSISSPVSNATVSGTTQQVTATASGIPAVTSVQFKLDGNNLGAADTAAPYGVSWDTTSTTNGNHVLTATATNSASQSATSAPVTVNVQNIVQQPGNLIANPGLETANGTAPASWLSSNWGTNTSTFSYVTTAHTGSHAVRVDTTAYTNGAANWFYADVPVTAGKMYQYTDWYESNVDTEVDAEVVMSNGTTSYYYLGTVLANAAWTQFKTTFVAPAGAKSMAIYQILAKKGYIVSDDYSLGEYTPAPLNHAIVSVTFDDGWANQYQNAFPIIKQYNIPSTFYIISGELADQPDYMTAMQVKTLQAAGNEIASHSVTHPDLTTLSATQLQNEMKNSQATLQATVSVPITDFAYPFGAYNANTIAVGKQYYQSQRSVNAGYNTKDNFDLTQLKIYEVDSNISQTQVKAWIDGAIADKAWLILVYHEIATTPTDPTDSLYTTQPGDLSAEMSYLKSTGVTLETVHQAINEVLPQL